VKFDYLQRRKEKEERANRYTNVMRALVWRYVASMHRKFEESAVTEDDINEVKGEISSMRYELLEVLEKNGMDISSAEKRKEKSKSTIFYDKKQSRNFSVFNIYLIRYSCSRETYESMGTSSYERFSCRTCRNIGRK
jgi:hypothetical protein